ncbi:MAG: exonuclease domain-containing protein [Candidatus Marinimicrobia bacterium]|nr:exonuclease domain-containing protein [Candidatus Neomarinimicrobiota bacterium]
MKRILALILTLLLLFSCSKKQDLMPISDLENDERLLAHIDVETTGLIPGYHEMIDIGLVITDVQGNMIDSLFLLIQPEYPERLQPGAYDCNAFNAELWKKRKAFTIDKAVDSILSFHKRVCGDKQVWMIAFNSHFDAGFLDHLFRHADHSWREMYHYMILDIPSMLWGMGYTDSRGYRFMEYYQIKDEPHVAEFHTGITGAMVNVRIYKALMDLHR